MRKGYTNRRFAPRHTQRAPCLGIPCGALLIQIIINIDFVYQSKASYVMHLIVRAWIEIGTAQEDIHVTSHSTMILLVISSMHTEF